MAVVHGVATAVSVLAERCSWATPFAAAFATCCSIAWAERTTSSHRQACFANTGEISSRSRNGAFSGVTPPLSCRGNSDAQNSGAGRRRPRLRVDDRFWRFQGCERQRSRDRER